MLFGSGGGVCFVLIGVSVVWYGVFLYCLLWSILYIVCLMCVCCFVYVVCCVVVCHEYSASERLSVARKGTYKIALHLLVK